MIGGISTWRKEVALYIKFMKEKGYKASQIEIPDFIEKGTYPHRVWMQEIKKEKFREEAKNIDIKSLMQDVLLGKKILSEKEEKILKFF